jgi:CRP-like cAMP-binding protein
MYSLSSSVIDSLTGPDRAIVFDRLVRRSLRRGEALYFAGEQVRRVHFVGTGVLKLSGRGAEGSETILCLALPGEVVGEVAALDGLPQPLDAVAARPSVVHGMDSRLLIEILERNPGAATALAEQMGSRLRWICEAAQERTFSEVPARLASRLLSLAELLGQPKAGAIEMDLPLAQHDLASMAGMCRESACKTLRMFKAAGLLDYRGRRVRILRPEGLERIRCGARVKKDSRSELG